MDATNRARTLAHLLRTMPTPGLVKPDVKAAVDAMDDFLEANATAINNAFPQPFRGVASTAQKLTVIAYVAMRRAGLLKVQEDF